MVKIGTQYKHNNGIIYTVIMVTNTGNPNPKYPITVVYMGINGKVWSRPLSTWESSFTEIQHKNI